MTDPPTNPAPSDQRRVTVAFTEAEIDEMLDFLDLRLGHSVSEAPRDLYRRLREARRHHPQGAPMPHTPDDDDDDAFYAPPQPVRPSPAVLPRRGIVIRTVDVTGISGLGHIVEFCKFSDGATAWRWLGGPPQNQPKWEFYDNPGTAPFEQISGHNGNTEIVFIDDPEPDA